MSSTRLRGRLLLVALATVTALLCTEGLLSLTGMPTLHGLLARRPDEAPLLTALRQRRQDPASLLRVGEFDIDPDPRVGRVLRPDATLEVHGAPVTTDALGMRRRLAPPRGKDCQRVVILGDSVAFGWGLSDDQTIAHRLESLLAACLAPQARPVEVQTVAVPGWNLHNAFAFLFDHLDELRPDVVVYLPVSNDLCDGIAEYQTSRGLVPVPDLSAEDPWLNVGYPVTLIEELLARRGRGEATVSLNDAGVVAVETGLGRTSRSRYAGIARSLAEAQARLAPRDGRLYLAPMVSAEFLDLLLDALLDQQAHVPVIPLLDHVEAGDTLPTDPHPSAAATDHFAAWIARRLLDDGALQGALAAPLPDVPADVQARRAAPPEAGSVRARAASARAATLRRLLPELDTRSGRGCLQVYGGVGAAGEVGPRALFLLRRDADVLRLRLQVLADRPDVLPLEVAVEADGLPTARLVLGAEAASAPAPQEFEVALAAGERGGPIDIKLIPACWVALRGEDGASRLAAFRLLSADCVAR